VHSAQKPNVIAQNSQSALSKQFTNSMAFKIAQSKLMFFDPRIFIFSPYKMVETAGVEPASEAA